MKLQQLIDGSFYSDFTLIHDDKNEKGSLILNEFIKQNVNQKNNTHLVCLERNRSVLREVPLANFTTHCISDPKGWLNGSLDGTTQYHSNPSEVIQNIMKSSKSDTKTVIIIDSLALYFILYPESCYRTIHSVVNRKIASGKQQQQVICLLHTDMLPGEKQTLLMFEQLATTNIAVSRHKKHSLVTLRHRKSSGRVIESIEEFYIDKQGFHTKEFKKAEEKATESSGTEWVKSNVTFKLELEDDEKRARSELVLPYLKTSNQSGQIIYEPDENDDWDEEDPDDDLNI